MHCVVFNTNILFPEQSKRNTLYYPKQARQIMVFFSDIVRVSLKRDFYKKYILFSNETWARVATYIDVALTFISLSQHFFFFYKKNNNYIE